MGISNYAAAASLEEQAVEEQVAETKATEEVTEEKAKNSANY